MVIATHPLFTLFGSHHYVQFLSIVLSYYRFENGNSTHCIDLMLERKFPFQTKDRSNDWWWPIFFRYPFFANVFIFHSSNLKFFISQNNDCHHYVSDYENTILWLDWSTLKFTSTIWSSMELSKNREKKIIQLEYLYLLSFIMTW